MYFDVGRCLWFALCGARWKFANTKHFVNKTKVIREILDNCIQIVSNVRHVHCFYGQTSTMLVNLEQGWALCFESGTGRFGFCQINFPNFKARVCKYVSFFCQDWGQNPTKHSRKQNNQRSERLARQATAADWQRPQDCCFFISGVKSTAECAISQITTENMINVCVIHTQVLQHRKRKKSNQAQKIGKRLLAAVLMWNILYSW